MNGNSKSNKHTQGQCISRRLKTEREKIRVGINAFVTKDNSAANSLISFNRIFTYIFHKLSFKCTGL